MKPATANFALEQRRAARQLAELYSRNGYVRLPNKERREAENQLYKKGYEVRLIALSEAELRTMDQSLRLLGFKPGKTYAKHHQMVLPVYGKQAVADFQALVRKSAASAPRKANKHERASFDDFLVEDGIYTEVKASARKQVLAGQTTKH